MEPEHLPLVWTLVVVLAATALRVSEASGLRWSDLDFKRGKIKIQRGFTADGGIDKPKSRASRSRSTVEMHEALQAVFMDWRSQTIYGKDQDFIFPSYRLKGAKPRLGSMIVQDYIRPAAEKLGLRPPDCKRFGLHNLRHSLGTWLVNNDIEPIVVVRMLRQSDVKMAMHYAHLDKKAWKAQGNSWRSSCRSGYRNGYSDFCTRRLNPLESWSGRRDLNPRLRPWQGRTLPLSYSRSTCLIIAGRPTERQTSAGAKDSSGAELELMYPGQKVEECHSDRSRATGPRQARCSLAGAGRRGEVEEPFVRKLKTKGGSSTPTCATTAHVGGPGSTSLAMTAPRWDTSSLVGP